MSEVHRKFLNMEISENLFSLKSSNDIYFWDLIRREVFIIINSKNPYDKTNNSIKKTLLINIHNYFKDLIKAILNHISMQYIARKKPDYIFTTFQRSFKNGQLYDNVVDDLVDLVKDDALCIEYVNKIAINKYQLILGGKTKVPPVYIYTSKDLDNIDEINSIVSAKIYDHFNLDIDFSGTILQCIQTFKTTENFYNKLFKKHSPKKIICTDDGTLKGLFSAARTKNIEVAEIQHGASPGSILWTYDKTLDYKNEGLYMPTIFMTFSKYWKEIIDFPCKEKIEIGNNNFFQSQVKGRDGICFISNNLFHDDFIRLAIELEAIGSEQNIYYKLHPQQYKKKELILNQLPKNSKINILTNEFPSNKLFEECSYFVAVRSSLIYSALQAGKNILIYKKYNYDWDKILLQSSVTFLTAYEINYAINNTMKKNTLLEENIYFNKFDSRKFLKFLKR